MNASDTQAHAAFSTAEKALQTAINNYAKARKELHAKTGQFAGVDDRALLAFTAQAGGPAPASAGAGAGTAAEIQTDC